MISDFIMEIIENGITNSQDIQSHPGYEAWRRRKDYVNDLYEKVKNNQLSQPEFDRLIEIYDDENYNTPLKKAVCKHVEGRTPLDGWIICKLCGENLRKL